MDSKLTYKIALSLLPGIGGVLARNLIAYVGDVEGIFKESLQALKKIPGIGEHNARQIRNATVIPRAEKEIEFIQQQGIKTYFYTDSDYPRRLKPCIDAPILIFSKGSMTLNEERVISIVGTRNATEYGKKIVDDLIKDISKTNNKTLIISGLAYGIDIQAHRSAVKHKLQTIGVVAHGLDTLYPSLHKKTAKAMEENGGILSDFISNTRIDPRNFIKRNRIIAGLSDATIVVESAKKGGALVTADIASSYNRDVFAFPGRSGDNYSKGCNQLIRNNGATLIEGIEDLAYFMGWDDTPTESTAQTSLFIELNDNEKQIVTLLQEKKELFIDQIATEIRLPISQISASLISLEFKNIVNALPGKMYKLK